MSELSEDYTFMRSESQERRRNNREQSADILRREGIKFETHNAGAHLIVTYAARVADFWPGTGKWIIRRGPDLGLFPYAGRGVFNLLKAIRS